MERKSNAFKQKIKFNFNYNIFIHLSLFLCLMQIRILVLFILGACKKYEDPDPFTDPRIKNKYCNIPSAINYNWDFPGIEDNTTCIFPAQIYQGTYLFHDTIIDDLGAFVSKDSFYISFLQIDSTKLTVTGFCGVNPYMATANRFFKFTLDSLLGNGQQYCNQQDTIAGGGSKASLQDTNTIQIVYQLQTDTGVVLHKGTAFKN